MNSMETSKRHPLRIGLTGGIGSGKTVVSGIFEVLGVPVFYADNIAKAIMNADVSVKQQITALFGKDAYLNSKLNSQFIADKVFRNKALLEKLNAIVHPATIIAAEHWFATQQTLYVIKEAALLFEAGTAAGLDYIIGVAAPEQIKIHRVMKRDGSTREQVLQRINRQIDDEIKMKLCDFLITNDEVKPLLPQVISLHKKLSELSVMNNTLT